MTTQEKFTSLSHSLQSAVSKNNATQILKKALEDPEVRVLIQKIIDPNQCIDRKPPEFRGIGPATINALLKTQVVQDLKMMKPVIINEKEGRELILENLYDEVKWVIQPRPRGVHCLLEIKNDIVMLRISNTLCLPARGSQLEIDIRTIFNLEKEISLDGYVFRENVKYGQFYKQLISGNLDQINFTILDYINLGKDFSERQDFLSNYAFSNSLKFLPACSIIDFDNQIYDYKNQGYAGCFLRNLHGAYQFGTSLDLAMLTFKD
jgi:hypothetical protein